MLLVPEIGNFTQHSLFLNPDFFRSLYSDLHLGAKDARHESLFITAQCL